ncbi:MAG: helix-turn-helix domain-containing protein [Pirellulales bacterium]
MAGKFLSLEEAARHLGVTVEEINRLIDRKKLFPMRDGATVKFKLEDIDRVASELDDEPAASGNLSLELELSSPAIGGPASGPDADENVVLGEAIEETESIFGSAVSGSAQPVHTMIRGGDDELVIDDAGSGLESADLALESIIGASSLSLARGPAGSLARGPAATQGGNAVSDIGIDLSNLGSGSIVAGSGPGLSGPTPGAVLSGPLDSGLSLEGGNIGGSGIVLGDSLVASGVDAFGGSLAGDAFELGDSVSDDESASVVIATEDTGDSSFFGTVTDDSGSVSLDDSIGSAGVLVGDESFTETMPAGPPFSLLQILGLICCTLFLLTCSLVMIDLVWAVRAPGGTPLASPLLKALSETFAWR